MKKVRRNFFVLAVCFVVAFAFANVPPASANEGEDMTIHNETGHAVAVFMFTDGKTHTNEKGGTRVQAGLLQNHQSAVAHVPVCHFEILLVDKNDIWHAELEDCHSTDMTFTSAQHDTRH